MGAAQCSGCSLRTPARSSQERAVFQLPGVEPETGDVMMATASKSRAHMDHRALPSSVVQDPEDSGVDAALHSPPLPVALGECGNNECEKADISDAMPPQPSPHPQDRAVDGGDAPTTPSTRRRQKQPRQRPQSSEGKAASAARSQAQLAAPTAEAQERSVRQAHPHEEVAQAPLEDNARQKSASAQSTVTKREKRQKGTASDLKEPLQEGRSGGRVTSAASQGSRSCPSSASKDMLEKELRQVQKRMQSSTRASAPQASSIAFLDSELSAGERDAKLFMFVSFYRETYQRLKAQQGQRQGETLDESAYAGQDTAALSIQDGHRHMPRPQSIDLPGDHHQQVGVLSAEELAKYDCKSKRMLVSVHGDLFDVSDRPDKYSADGPYWSMTGHDITWGLFCGKDTEDCYDQYYDIFKTPDSALDRKLQGICSWWAFYESEYGPPVGKLDVYEKEWKLPAPPWEGDEACSIM